MGTGAEIALYAALAATAISTGVSVYSQQQQAKTQERIAAYNAKRAEQEAANREREASEARKRARIEKRKRLARIRNDLASRGTLTNVGAPLAILGESAGNMELRIQDAARASSMQAASLRAGGAMGLWEADQYSSAANLQSIGTVASGLASMGGTYAGGVYNGTFNDTFGIYRTKTTA